MCESRPIFVAQFSFVGVRFPRPIASEIYSLQFVVPSNPDFL